MLTDALLLSSAGGRGEANVTPHLGFCVCDSRSLGEHES